MKIASCRNVVAGLILAFSASASAAPVTIAIGSAFDYSTSTGTIAPPITTSATLSFDTNSFSVSGYTSVIGYATYQDVTVLSFTAPTIQLSDWNGFTDYNPFPLGAGDGTNSGLSLQFFTESVRSNGAPAVFTRAYLSLSYSLENVYSSSPAYSYASYQAALYNTSPNPNDGDPAQFLDSVRQGSSSISGSAGFYFVNYDDVGALVLNQYFGTAQLLQSTDVPEPASLLLLLSGLLGVGLVCRGSGRAASTAAA